jgi:CRISPR-associated endonuclease/helicase Cas3
MEECCSLLVICNTKSEARNLFQKMQSIAQDNQWKIYHLSTSMCQQHRMDVLKTIEKQLKILQAKGGESECSQKIICISTQLVEAGIDFSFESVVRVIAGMDNLAQAAGRCNRSNEYGRICKVYLIRLQDENLGMLQEIYKAQISTMMVLEKYESCIENLLLKDEAIRQFYHFYFEEIQTYRKYPIEDNKWYLVNLLANQNSSEKKKTSQQFIFRQPFKTVAEKFQVYDNDTIDILVPYEDGTKLIQDLKRLEAEGGFFNISHMTELLQKAKHFTVSIFENQKKQLLEVGMLDPLFEERILVLNEKAYHEDYGIGDITEPEVASFIF